ncbi:MAG: hypothetical protein BZ137_09245 [Methanosphaera sp. rholeuAM130]|nr:MAG: hypothetical protein BZ137_09245 [Methanosphaera sp. rholeuAM130]
MHFNKKLSMIFLSLILVFLTVSVVSATSNVTDGSTDSDNLQSTSIQKIEDASKITSINDNEITNEKNIEKTDHKNIKKDATLYVATNGKSTNSGTQSSPYDINTAFTKVQSTKGGNIIINAGTYKLTAPLTLNTAGTYTITGQKDKTILDGQSKNRILSVGYNVNVTISGIVFTNGYVSSSDAGAAVLKQYDGSLNIRDSTFKNNKAGYGAAIYNRANNAVISNSVFTNNVVTVSGGAIYNLANRTTVSYSNFTQNSATNLGGAVYTSGHFTTINNNNFIKNTAKIGGAVEDYAGNNFKVSNNIFTENSANSAGALYSNANNSVFMNNQFNKNTANDTVGAMVTYTTNNVNITGNKFNSNKAKNSYGAIAITNSQNTNVIGNEFIQNQASVGGGAIGVLQSKTTLIKSNNFTKNDCEKAAASIFSDGEYLTLTQNIFTQNHAYRSAGAIYDEGKYLTITDNEFISNVVDVDGGAIFIRTNYSTISNNIFKQNKVNNSGGAAYFDGNHALFTNNKFIENTAKFGGGAVYLYSTKNMTFKNNEFTSNYAAESGGAVMTSHANNTTFISNTFSKNKANSAGGAIVNYDSKIVDISSNTFDSNNAGSNGGAVSNLISATVRIKSNTFTKNTATSSGGAVYTNATNININSNQFTNNNATNAAAISNRANTFEISSNTFTMNTAQATGTPVKNYGTDVTMSGNRNYGATKYAATIYNDGNNGKIINNIFEDEIKTISTTTTVYRTEGVVGEKITLKATVKDANGKNVNGGYVLFKINDITVKSNGQINGSTTPLKVSVVNGVAQYDIVAYLNVRNGKKLTAVYAGTDGYAASRSNNATAQIQRRQASLVVTTNVTKVKQDQYIRLIANVRDITKQATTNMMSDGTDYVYFKVNGLTLKNSDGSVAKVKVVNGVATYDYKVPLGLSGVTDCQTLNPKNHTVMAGYYNPNYVSDIKNSSTFQVERSDIKISMDKITVFNRTKKITITGTIKDYNNNYVRGNNKVIIKINGVSLKDSNNEPIYYQVTEGKIDLQNITIPPYKNFNEITMVTQDRVAYKSAQAKSTSIEILNQ